jgi:hypothetical protein
VPVRQPAILFLKQEWEISFYARWEQHIEIRVASVICGSIRFRGLGNMKKTILAVASLYTALICLAVVQSGSGETTIAAIERNISSGLPASTATIARQP